MNGIQNQISNCIPWQQQISPTVVYQTAVAKDVEIEQVINGFIVKIKGLRYVAIAVDDIAVLITAHLTK